MKTIICIKDETGHDENISHVLKQTGYKVLSAQDITEKLKIILAAQIGQDDHVIDMPDDKTKHQASIVVLTGNLLRSVRYLENSFLTYLVEMVAIEILEQADKSGNPELAEEFLQDSLQLACA